MLNHLVESASESLNCLQRRFNDSRISAICVVFLVVGLLIESLLNCQHELPLNRDI
jgi:hypothetical protein